MVIDASAMWANPLAADFNAPPPPVARRRPSQAATAAAIARDVSDLAHVSASTPENVKIERNSAHDSVASVEPSGSLNLKDVKLPQNTEVAATKGQTDSCIQPAVDLAGIDRSSPLIPPLNISISGVWPSHINVDNQASMDNRLSGSFSNRAARRLTAALSMTRSSIHSESDFLGDDVDVDDNSSGTRGTPESSSIPDIRDVPRGPLVDGVRTRKSTFWSLKICSFSKKSEII